MSRIRVTDGQVVTKDMLYYRLVEFLSEVKLVQGNIALNSTINRHRSVKEFLLHYQVDTLLDLEESVKLLTERES